MYHQNFQFSLKKINSVQKLNDQVYSELQISKNCNSHLLQRIIELKRNAVASSHYHRREPIEINPVTESLAGLNFRR